MINTLAAKNFAGVPYLETSQLMQNHEKGVTFSAEKPTVILGPNGAGKSALMKALAFLTLSYYSGESAFDDTYTTRGDGKSLWAAKHEYGNDWEYLKGLVCDSDPAPALFYRPGAIPGGYNDVTEAMMCGYSGEAKTYARLTEKKSSGQQSQAILKKLMAALAGDFPAKQFGFANWSQGKKQRTRDQLRSQGYTGPWEYQAEILKARYYNIPDGAIPAVLMDEPEQSLDAKAEALLWKQIESSDPTKVQVIIATHSLYPFLHPERFHVIEAVPGYIAEVQALL